MRMQLETQMQCNAMRCSNADAKEKTCTNVCHTKLHWGHAGDACNADDYELTDSSLDSLGYWPKELTDSSPDS